MIGSAPGVPQNSGILIPEVWSGKLLTKFYAATTMAAIANTDYEGEIKSQGDKVIIRTTPDIEIRDYVKGQPLNIQRPEAGRIELAIDRAKYWNFVIDSIDKFQSDIPFFNKWSDDASMQLKIVWDRLAFSEIYVDASPYNSGATAGLESGSINLGVSGSAALTVGNGGSDVSPVDFITRINQCLDEQNVPENDRFIIIPSWLSTKLKLSDLKNAYLTGDAISPLRNGRIGDVDRSTLYTSNLLSTETISAAKCWRVIGGQKSALTYAAQITESETLKAESTFGHIGRGLHVCGWKVIKPEALVTAIAKPGT
jgi:hypothetical protein